MRLACLPSTSRVTLQPVPPSLILKRHLFWRRKEFNIDRPVMSTLLLRGRHPITRVIGFGCFSVVFGGALMVVTLLAWDATTYSPERLGE